MIRHCVEESNVDSDMNVIDPTKIRHVTVAGGKIALISGLIDPASHLNLDFPDHRARERNKKMITINSTIGNIYHDDNLRKRYEEMSSQSLLESIRITRMEAQRVRMRKTSSKGTDIALTMTPGTKLRHGDVLMVANDKMITIELEPENLAVIQNKDNIHEHDDDDAV